jgi:AraC-like DNA-binding protein
VYQNDITCSIDTLRQSVDIIRMTNEMRDAGGSPVSGVRTEHCYAGISVYEPGDVLGPRLLSDFEAVLVLEGAPLYETDEGAQVLEPGSIVLAQPGGRETYRWDTERRTRHAFLHFTLEGLSSNWPDSGDWPRWQLHPAPILGQILQHLVQRAMHHPDGTTRTPGYIDNRLLETFLDLYLSEEDVTGLIAPRFLSEPVRVAARFMRERIDRPVFEPYTLDELAATAHVSSKHLCRAFQKELRISPMKACRKMQFLLATSLLARTNLRIKAIALRCGFPDQHHFSRAFSQCFGRPPSEVRRAMLQGNPPPQNPLPAALMPQLYW